MTTSIKDKNQAMDLIKEIAVKSGAWIEETNIEKGKSVVRMIKISFRFEKSSS